jgi:hypothetical protein
VTQRSFVPAPFVGTIITVFALAGGCATSAAASEVSFDGEVLRYRGANAEKVYMIRVRLRKSIEQRYWQIGAFAEPGLPVPPVDVGPGCSLVFSEPDRVVHCQLVPSREQPRYRFNVGSTEAGFYGNLRGVVYGGGGPDLIFGADRVYGGAGEDDLEGVRLYGGPGSDLLQAKRIAPSDQPIQHGGAGRDSLNPPGWLYGGPGPDWFDDSLAKSADMLVGGPGKDYVEIWRDGHDDVVRIRGGGRDIVVCYSPDPGDVLFVDRSDDVDSECKKKAIVLYTERPRYPYR